MDSDSSDSEICSRPNCPEAKMIKLDIEKENSNGEQPRYFNDGIKSKNPEENSPLLEKRKTVLRTQLSQPQSRNFSKDLKRTVFHHNSSQEAMTGNPLLERSVMLPIFRYLSPKELVQCALVCRGWAKLSLDPILWRRLDLSVLSHKRLTASHLAGIARRKPEILILDWSYIAKKQLGWLIGRLPELRELSVQGCSWAGVSALCTSVCPPLHMLDLSFVGGLNDLSLRDILSPPSDSRPGLTDTKSRLRHLSCLKLAACDISDVSLRHIAQYLTKLAMLDLSSCTRITDEGVAQLTASNAPTVESLTSLNLSNLRAITDLSLEHLCRCQNLEMLNLTHTPLINAEAVGQFKETHYNVLILGKE